MSESAVLSALKTILPVGTTVPPESVYIRQGVTPKTAVWPTLMLNVPLSDEDQMTLGGAGAGSFQVIHVVHALYLDQWIAGTRTFEQIMADADAQITQMHVNVRSNPSLTVDGTDNCMEVRHVQRRLLGQFDDKQLDFPLIQAQLILWVADFFAQYSP